MTIDPSAPVPGDPASSTDLPARDPQPSDLSAGPEARTFKRPEGGEAPVRPQADFGAPISLSEDGDRQADTPPADDELGVPRVTGGEVPPLYAMADDAAEPVLPEPRVERPLTVRIHQGMPSYSEPDPDIAGIVGRAARGGDTADGEEPNLSETHDGGLP